MNHASQVGTAAAVPSSPIVGAMNALDRSVADLHENIGELERRLEAALRPALPETTPPAPAPVRGDQPAQERSRIASEVIGSASAVERATNRVAALMARLEV